jgi:hypothetical protein
VSWPMVRRVILLNSVYILLFIYFVPTSLNSGLTMRESTLLIISRRIHTLRSLTPTTHQILNPTRVS